MRILVDITLCGCGGGVFSPSPLSLHIMATPERISSIDNWSPIPARLEIVLLMYVRSAPREARTLRHHHFSTYYQNEQPAHDHLDQETIPTPGALASPRRHGRASKKIPLHSTFSSLAHSSAAGKGKAATPPPHCRERRRGAVPPPEPPSSKKIPTVGESQESHI